MESAKRAEEVLSSVGKTRNRKGGRPSKKKVSGKAVATALGTSRQSVERAEETNLTSVVKKDWQAWTSAQDRIYTDRS